MLEEKISNVKAKVIVVFLTFFVALHYNSKKWTHIEKNVKIGKKLQGKTIETIAHALVPISHSPNRLFSTLACFLEIHKIYCTNRKDQ